ncbi:hypothetical protein CERSUDRAFT_56003, partial [Gelatoporia subvermispora B]
IYQARCEVDGNRICTPIKVAVSLGGSCIAVGANGGWKNREPVVHYYFHKAYSIDPGLAEPVTQLALDDDRKLIFVADGDRVKSFSWKGGKGSPVHTLNSMTSGPIAILPRGHIIRAGDGRFDYWRIDELEVHGPKKKLIGRGKYNIDDLGRDNDYDEVERSNGSDAHGRIKLEQTRFCPQALHVHQPTGRILCGETTPASHDGGYGCVAIDLEHGGKTAIRYLGHGGTVVSFSTGDFDPYTLATACSDGFARDYDVRQKLLILTMDTSNLPFESVVCHTHDYATALFTGGSKTERIQMWDIRARRTVYELATGNNAVASMAWDKHRSTLWAATECEYMDRNGTRHEYRKARIRRDGTENLNNADAEGFSDGGSDEDSDEEEEGYLDEDEHDCCWPNHAYHGEDYFGYTFDAGDHRIYRYAFKADAKTAVVPEYGDATMGEENDW